MLTVGITLVVAHSLAAAPDTGALTGHFRGEAAVVKGDRAAARAAALQNAFADALVTGSGVIDSPTMLECAAPLHATILGHAADYLPSFTLSLDSLDPNSTGIYQVELADVVVRREKLAHDVAGIRAMATAQGHPRICTIIREDFALGGPDTASNKADWTAGQILPGLKSRLLPLGWKFVTAKEITRQPRASSKAGEALQHLSGRDFDSGDADYVIVGSVSIHAVAAPRALQSAISVVQVQVAIRVTDPVTSDTVAAVESSQLVSGIDGMPAAVAHAIASSTDSIANALAGPVLTRWRQAATGSGGLQLKVLVDDYDALTVLEDALRGRISGVRSIEELRYEDGVAAIKVSGWMRNTWLPSSRRPTSPCAFRSSG
jgi:hypothetical protein